MEGKINLKNCEEICSECKGKGHIEPSDKSNKKGTIYLLCCPLCNGKKTLTWTEIIKNGKTLPDNYDIVINKRSLYEMHFRKEKGKWYSKWTGFRNA